MYSALQIARHLINYGIDKNIDITNLRLPKYIYLLDKLYQESFKENLVIEKCENKHYGAFYEVVWCEFRDYSYHSIDRQESYSQIEFNEEKHQLEINEYKIEPINDIKLYIATRLLFERYGKFDLYDLMTLTKTMLQEE